VPMEFNAEGVDKWHAVIFLSEMSDEIEILE
jgi:hypothetical protein